MKKPRTIMVASVLMGMALTAALFSIFGLAGYSLFSGQSGAVSTSISTGVVKVALSATGASESLGIGAQNIAPGDTMQREVDVSNSGTSAIGNVTFGVTASNTTASIYSSSTDGLQVSVLECSGSWTPTLLSDGGYSYTCNGTQSTAYGPDPIADVASGVVLPTSLSDIPVGGSSSFVVQVSFPTSAGNSQSSETESFTWNFTATQAAAGAV